MKRLTKIICIVLFVSVLVDVLCVSAFAVDSISFRDLEWYETKQNVTKHIIENYWVSNQEKIKEENIVSDSIFYSFFVQDAWRNNNDKHNIHAFSSAPGDYSEVIFVDENVATLEAYTTLYFINPVFNNEIVKNSNNAKFVCANYSFYIDSSAYGGKSIRTTRESTARYYFKKLLPKLISLYGDPTELSEIIYDAYWEAEDGSALCLRVNSSWASEYSTLTLTYLAPNAYEEAKENQDMEAYLIEQRKQEQEQRAQSTNGL